MERGIEWEKKSILFNLLLVLSVGKERYFIPFPGKESRNTSHFLLDLLKTPHPRHFRFFVIGVSIEEATSYCQEASAVAWNQNFNFLENS